MKQMILERNFIEKYSKMHEQMYTMHEQLVSRITEILCKVILLCEFRSVHRMVITNDSWSWYGVDLDSDFFDFDAGDFEGFYVEDACFALCYYRDVRLDSLFDEAFFIPREFLFDDSGIQEYLDELVQPHLEKKKIKTDRDTERQQLIESASKKLTDAEKKALGLPKKNR